MLKAAHRLLSLETMVCKAQIETGRDRIEGKKFIKINKQSAIVRFPIMYAFSRNQFMRGTCRLWHVNEYLSADDPLG